MYMHNNFFNVLWEFTRQVKEGRESFIQSALKLSRTFKVNSLKTPKLDVAPKKTKYNLFYIYM